MSRLSTVTFEQIATTADSIKAKNEIPGCKNIRAELGTGSYSTILKHLYRWQESQKRVSQEIDDTLDPTIIRAISNQITERVVASNAASTQSIANLQEEMGIVISESERLTIEVQEKDEELIKANGQNATLQGRLQDKEEDIKVITVDLSDQRRSNELLRVELAKAGLRLEALPKFETTIAALQQELNQARNLSSNMHEAAAVAEARLEAKTMQCNELERKLSEAIRERDVAVNQAAVAANTMENERKEGLARQRRLDEAANNLNLANEIARNAREEVAELRGQLLVMNLSRTPVKANS